MPERKLSRPMKVLLVDDHPLVLNALKQVIESIRDAQVQTAETAADCRAALNADDSFDLVLLDLALGKDDGFELLSEVRNAYPALPVVVVSASDRHADVIRSIDGGAMGYIPKRTSQAELREALSLVMHGGLYVPPMMLGLFGKPPVPEDLERAAAAERAALAARDSPFQQMPESLAAVGLTPRQTDVLNLLLQGKPNKLIARELNVSVETVKDHVAAVLRALNVSSRTQAVLAVSQMQQQAARGQG